MATVLMMTCTPPPSFSDDIDKIERLTVAYIFNFAKFIEWEVLENSKADVKPLSICFYGALGNMSKYTFSLEQKKIKQRSVKTKKLSRGDDIADCEIIYISESESKYVNLLLAHAEKNNMLTISRLDSFMESGGMIELLEVDNKLRFDINLAKAKSNNLFVSSQLLRLARKVIE